jgi:hypothetical protein
MGVTSHHDNKKVIIKLERVDNEIFYALEQAYFDAGKLLESDLKKGLKRGKRSGVLYSGKSFRASIAGEYPQRVSGLLRKNVKFKVFSYKAMWFGITDAVPYAPILEDRKRLLVTHTVNKLDAEVKNILEKRLNNAIKKD